MAKLRITNQIELEGWLKKKPRGWAVVIAARAALRVLPNWKGYFELRVLPEDLVPHHEILHLFRYAIISNIYVEIQNDARLRAAFKNINRYTINFSNISKYESLSAACEAMIWAANLPHYSDNMAAIAGKSVYLAALSAYFASSYTASNHSAAFVWQAVEADAAALAKSISSAITGRLWRTRDSADLAHAKIVPAEAPESATRNWGDLKKHLGKADNWQVWTEWYEAVLNGHDAWGLSRDVGNEIILTALMWPETEWQRGPAHVNRRMAEMIAEARAKAVSLVSKGDLEPQHPPRTDSDNLTLMQSPDVILRSDGVVDLLLNRTYDTPTPTKDFHELPGQQISLIDALVEGLPGNAPKLLRASLVAYRDHLQARPRTPFLGTLNQHEVIVRAEFESKDAKEWCSRAQTTAHDIFKTNHTDIRENFPLDAKRDATYAATEVDESKLDSPAVRRAFAAMVDAADNAERAGAITSEVKVQIKADAELAKTLTGLVIVPGDRPVPPGISPAKRFILNKFGFYKRLAEVSAVGGGAVTIVKDGPDAFHKLATAATGLWELLRKFWP